MENETRVRQLIAEENLLINHRMNWFLILQGFMFAGIGFAWDKSTSMCIVFSVVGLVSSVSVGVLLGKGIQAIKKLEKDAEGSLVLGMKYDDTSKFVRILLPWNMLPVLMIVAWGCLILIKVFRLS